MTKKQATYHIIPAPADPQIEQICERLFHRAISAQDGAALVEEIMHRRWLEWQAGWISLDSGNGWICFAQEDELVREEKVDESQVKSSIPRKQEQRRL